MFRNSRNLISVLVGAVLVVVSLSFVRTGSGDPGQPGSLMRAANVGTVDVERVINEFMKMTGDMDRTRARWAAERRALDATRESIESMRQEADIYPKTSPRFLELATQVAIKSKTLEVQLESNERGLNREQARLMQDAYRKASEVIAGYAKEKGLDLVMQTQSSEFQGLTLESVSSQIIVRSTLFANGALDITDAIIERMR